MLGSLEVRLRMSATSFPGDLEVPEVVQEVSRSFGGQFDLKARWRVSATSFLGDLEVWCLVLVQEVRSRMSAMGFPRDLEVWPVVVHEGE